MAKLDLNTAETGRVNLTKKQQDNVRKLYKRVAKQIDQELSSLPNTPSSGLTKLYLEGLKAQINENLAKVAKEIEASTTEAMEQVSNLVVEDNLEFLKAIGMPIEGAFSHVSGDVISAISSGKIYEGKWTFSKAIWGMEEKTQKDINKVVAEGVALNKSAYEIAKDLEKYVNPTAAKPWDWSKVYPGTSRKVDYNAQRLARTLVSHAYQQAFVRTTKNNPFVIKYRWLASNSARTCPLCADRDQKLFDKNSLPLDHPNGMCTYEAEIPDSMTDIADRIGDWALGADDPELDAWAKDIYGEVPELLKPQFNDLQKQWLEPLGYSPDNMPGSFKEFMDHLTWDQTEKILKLSGGSWSNAHPYQVMEKWYNANLLSVKPGVTLPKSILTPKPTTSTGIPAIDQWIDRIRIQTEKAMLDLETKVMSLMSDAERQGIRVYSGNSYEEMNAYLRFLGAGLSKTEAIDRSGIRPSQLEALTNAISGLGKSKLDQPLVLRRGTDLGDLAGLLPGDFQSNFSSLRGLSTKELNDRYAGVVGTYHGFTSTSSLWNRGFSGNVEMVFYAPEGTEASSIMSISRFGTSEGETLLNAGTTVRIVSIEDSDGHEGSSIRIFAEIIP